MTSGPADTPGSGRFITFYSYKGGTGRSMALANVAYLLARGVKGFGGLPAATDQPVLVIDWDLEAPGLHRYFAPFLPNGDEPDDSPGLIELFIEVGEAVRALPSPDPGELASVIDGLDIAGRFCVGTHIPNLSLMKAGRFDRDYPSRVSNFRWDVLYERAPALIPALMSYLAERFAYILVDSRTGISDTSGICTMIMPELLVLVFTPNRQSLEGGIDLIRDATAYRRQSADLRPLVVFPLPSRIEAAKPELLEYWRKGSDEHPFRGYQAEFEAAFTAGYQLAGCDLTDYFDEIQIQHVPDYAYGEQIAVAREETDSRLSLRRSYESFTQRLIGLPSPWTDPGVVIAQARIAESCRLGAIELDNANDQRAQRHFSNAFETYQEGGDLYVPELVDGLRRLGARYLAQGQLAAAVTAFREAADVAERSFSPGDLRTAECLETLGDALTAVGKTLEALDVIMRALGMKKDALGGAHPAVADLGDKIGALLTGMGRLEEGRGYFVQSLEIRRNFFGSKAPALVTSLERLADTATAMGNLRDAERYLNEGLKLGDDGGDRSGRLRILGRLGRLNLRERDFIAAERYFQEALDTSNPASDDPAIADILDGSAQVAIEYGDFEKAQSCYERAQLIREAALGPSHPETLRGIVNLGDLAVAEGSPRRATTHYHRALSLVERTAGDAHPLVGEIYLKLGDVAQAEEAPSAAESLYRQAIDVYLRLDDEAGVSAGYRRIGTMAEARADYGNAEAWYRRSLEIDERLGDQAGLTVGYRNLGRLAQARRDYEQAGTWYRRSLEIAERLGDQVGIAAGYRNLGALAQARGEYQASSAPSARWRVFVSTTTELRSFPKGTSYAAAVREAISAVGHVLVDMADLPATDQTPAEMVRQQVRDCQVYVGVLGTHYGAQVPDTPAVSFTEFEFETATDAGLYRLVFLLDTDAEDVGIPPSRLIDRQFGDRQDAFRRRVRDAGLVTQLFADPATLRQLVERSLRELAEMAEMSARSGPGGPVTVVTGEIPQEPLGFQPRADLLAALSTPGRGVQVVTGMRGTGKTHLAAACARARVAAGWQLVAWINAGTRESVLTGLAEVAAALGLSPAAEQPRAPGQAVRRYLEADGDRCLMVFDNAADPEWLRPFLPAAGRSQVIITSDRPPAASLGTEVPMEMFSEPEALALLAARTGLADAKSARTLARELGFLPLALAQAAAVIATRRLSYATYLEELRGTSIRRPVPEQAGQYPKGAVAAVLISLDAIEAGDDGGMAAAVLNLLAVLASAGVPRPLLHAAGQAGMPARHRVMLVRTPEEVDQALGRLAGASLVTFSVDAAAVAVHPLVALMTRQNLASSATLGVACIAAASLLGEQADTLRRSWPPADAVAWDLAARDLMSQVDAVTEAAAAWPHDTDLERGLRQLGSWTAWLRAYLGDDQKKAILTGERLLAEQALDQGSEHPDTLASLDRLALAYQTAGYMEKAAEYHQRALDAREHVLGPDHPDTQASRRALALAREHKGTAPPR